MEALGDETELRREHGTLAQIDADGIDKEERTHALSENVNAHQNEGRTAQGSFRTPSPSK